MFRPHDLVQVQQEGYAHYGEVMQRQDPEFQDIYVRMVPGQPTTARYILVTHLQKAAEPIKWVQYAEIIGKGIFPVDMLRYDYAAPMNFQLVERFIHGQPAGLMGKLNVGERRFIIARATATKGQEWTEARWRSFGWSVHQMSVERYKHV